MSCHSDNSCNRGSLLKWMVLLALGAVVIASHKEILRYIKISSM